MTSILDFDAVVHRQATWRWEILDQSLERLGDAEVLRDRVPSLSVDTSRVVKRTVTNVEFPHSVRRHIDPIRDRIRLWMVLPDGSEFSQGVFLFADSNQAEFSSLPGSHVHTANLVDQGLILNQQSDRAHSVSPGTNVTDAMTFIIALFGVPVDIQIEPSSEVITPEQETISWPAGTNMIRIINELASMIGYHDLFFDNDGVGRLGPMPNPNDAGEETIISYPEGLRTYRPTVMRSTDTLQTPNRFIVVGAGATDQSVVGIFDVDDNAPHSFANRGFRVTHVEQMQGIESEVQARKAARALARSQRFPLESIEFSGPIDPRHDTYNVIGFEGDRFLELSWNTSLVDTSDMRHIIRRVYEGGDE